MIISDYKIEYKNKSKKILNTIENITKLEKVKVEDSKNNRFYIEENFEKIYTYIPNYSKINKLTNFNKTNRLLIFKVSYAWIKYPVFSVFTFKSNKFCKNNISNL